MNKSKFLKRSLATLLAILMVVAMVPMSAFAAVVIAEDVPTARSIDNPGYEIALNGIPFAWNPESGQYETDFGFVNDGFGSVPSIQLSMIENAATENTSFILQDTNETLTFTNKLVSLESANTVENKGNYGEGDYVFTLETRTETPEGQERNYYRLVIKARLRAADDDTTLLGVYSAQMPDMKTYTIEYYENGGGKVTIYMTLNTDLTTVTNKDGDINLFATGTNTDAGDGDALKKIFVTPDTVKSLSLNSGKLTITAENGHTDTYDVVLTHEAAFKTFALQEKKDGEVVATYEGKVFNNDPQKIVVDLPYDKFYEDAGNSNPYDEADPNPDYDAIDDKIEALFATWETDREETIVKYNTSFTGDAAEPGKIKVNVAEDTTTHENDTTNYPGINPENGNGDPNYIIFTSTHDATTATGSNADNTKGIFVDTLSRKVDSISYPTDYPHAGEVEIIVRVPRYNPSTKIEGIQIKGAKGNPSDIADNVVENVVNTEDGNYKGSETWSQYIAVNGTSIDITVPKDVLQLINKPSKKDEDGNSRAYIKLWGAYGADVEIPWDYVDISGNDDMDANGFDTDSTPGSPDGVLKGAKTGAEITSESTILLTEKNNSNNPQVKTVRIEVKSQDGNNTQNYDLRVRELTTEQHVTDLDSVTLYKADGVTEVAKASRVAGKNEWTIQLPYYLGSEDDNDFTIESYVIGAVAKNGGRISYFNGGANSDERDYTAFVKSQVVGTLTQAGNTFVAEEPNKNTAIQPATKNTFVLRVWDKEGIMDKDVGTDHLITFKMPAPNKEQRINKAELMANQLLTPGDGTGHPFTTTVDNIKKVITVELPYEYKDIPRLYLSSIDLDGIGARIYKDGANLTQVAYETYDSEKVTLTSDAYVVPDKDWYDEGSAKLYVFSEEGYTRLINGKSDTAGGTVTVAGNKISTISGYGTGDNFVYYTEYTVVAKILPAERLNRLNKEVTASDEFVNVNVDDANQIITITVPNKYLNENTATNGTATHDFTLDFTTDGKKARVYMDGTNNSTGTGTDVQRLNNGVPAGGIDEYKPAADSKAIVSKKTKFWVSKGATATDAPVLKYYTAEQTGAADTVAKEAIVAAEYSNWETTQENGGTRPYRINVKIADPETDPSIEELTVGGVNAVLREDADQGIATWTVNLPASSTPHQPMAIKFKGNFTTATIDGESFDKQAYYIVNKYAPVTIVATSESGVNKRYILKVGESDVSSDNSLKSIRVDGYTAVRDGATNDYYVTPGDNANLSEMSLYVTTNHSGAKVTVNSQPYTEGMTISLDGQDAVIVVTAENGDKATYNLKVGEAPAEKPSDKITDLDQCSNSLRSEVAEAIDLGIVQGVGNNKFDPQRKVTRKEFAVMVARADIIAAGKASSTSAADDVLKTEYLAAGGKFTDVAGQSEIFRAAINYCSANEIINGTGDGTTFSPDGTITREQAATMLARWTNTTSGSTTNTTFSDWNEVSNWAKGAVNGVTSTDPAIMNGIGGSKFGPKGTVTREMAATLVKRVYVNYSSK